MSRIGVWKTSILIFLVAFCLPLFKSLASPGALSIQWLYDKNRSSGQVELPYNKPEQIFQEMQDSNLLMIVAKSLGFNDQDLTTIKIAADDDPDILMMYQVKHPDTAFREIGDRLGAYAQARLEGHTKAYSLLALTNEMNLNSIQDKDLQLLISNQTFIVSSTTKRVASGTTTNKAGSIISMKITTAVVNGKPKDLWTTNIAKVDTISRWVDYNATDGDITWAYRIEFKPDGSLDGITYLRHSSKEDDPKYQPAFKEVEGIIKNEMQKTGLNGMFGSSHYFWIREKELLKARGIDWYSPDELNPNMIIE